MGVKRVNLQQLRFCHQRVLSIIICLLICTSQANAGQSDWISFNAFVEKYTVNHDVNSQHLIQLLRNPDPQEVEFGIRFSIGKIPGAINVFKKIWNDKDLTAYGLKKEYLANPIIKMAIANALYHSDNAQQATYYQYIKSVFLARNKLYYPFAIINLGDVGKPEDADLLVRDALQADKSDYFALLRGIQLIDKNYKTDHITTLKELVKNTPWKLKALTVNMVN